MDGLIQGLHHVTATVDGAQDDIDFYVETLGLRLTKKTVNFDNHLVYHFYYGTEVGTPGTLMTTFPYRGHGVAEGVIGNGQVTRTAFSVPVDSLAGWRKRLSDRGLEVGAVGGPFNKEGIVVSDPSGLTIELIGTLDDNRPPWVGGDLGGTEAIRGLHSVTLQVRSLSPTVSFMTDVMGFSIVEESPTAARLQLGDAGPGCIADVVMVPGALPGMNGMGTVHHVAWAVENDEDQLAARAWLIERGFSVTGVLDRNYFHSIYFREPGGVLFEIATNPPGFTVDEKAELLGRELKLPEWEESNRRTIEAGLEPIDR